MLLDPWNQIIQTHILMLLEKYVTGKKINERVGEKKSNLIGQYQFAQKHVI